MNKSKLKTGMRALTRNGAIGIIMLNTPFGDKILHDNKKHGTLNAYNHDLTQNFDEPEWDIIEIFAPHYNALKLCNLAEKGQSLWKRLIPEVMINVDGKEYSLSTLKKMIQQYSE